MGKSKSKVIFSIKVDKPKIRGVHAPVLRILAPKKGIGATYKRAEDSKARNEELFDLDI